MNTLQSSTQDSAYATDAGLDTNYNIETRAAIYQSDQLLSLTSDNSNGSSKHHLAAPSTAALVDNNNIVLKGKEMQAERSVSSHDYKTGSEGKHDNYEHLLPSNHKPSLSRESSVSSVIVDEDGSFPSSEFDTSGVDSKDSSIARSSDALQKPPRTDSFLSQQESGMRPCGKYDYEGKQNDGRAKMQKVNVEATMLTSLAIDSMDKNDTRKDTRQEIDPPNQQTVEEKSDTESTVECALCFEQCSFTKSIQCKGCGEDGGSFCEGCIQAILIQYQLIAYYQDFQFTYKGIVLDRYRLFPR